MPNNVNVAIIAAARSGKVAHQGDLASLNVLAELAEQGLANAFDGTGPCKCDIHGRFLYDHIVGGFVVSRTQAQPAEEVTVYPPDDDGPYYLFLHRNTEIMWFPPRLNRGGADEAVAA